ncbi:MAG: DNA alkylation repair protein [Clostridia bacterium]|nr:DNA alkylation repair protein [Clostridia bacterium]
MNEIKDRIISLGDEKYRDFSVKLIPTVSADTVIGVRAPRLRALAKKLIKNGEQRDFISALPHRYHDENILHAYLLNEEKDYFLCVNEIDRFLPFVDNWAVCDALRPKCVKAHKAEFIFQIDCWLASEHPYTARFGMEMLMLHYLGEDFSPSHLERVAGVSIDDYYVEMMAAWYFATALAEQWESTLPYLTDRRLPTWIHNKTIQKAIESYRISTERKNLLRGLKI